MEVHPENSQSTKTDTDNAITTRLEMYKYESPTESSLNDELCEAACNKREEETDATWSEVASACCSHSAQEWAMIFGGFLVVLFFLYFFLFGLDLLGTGARVLGGCTAGALFGDDTNPIAGLMIGILSTVLLQSSSTTTSIVVSLVGAKTVSVQQGIYMVMGANVGTSVTNTIVAIGHLGDGDQLERAFAGAVVHDVFNFLSVGVFLPLEIVTGYLKALTEALVVGMQSSKGGSWEGPIKKLVGPLVKRVIISNKKVITAVAEGKSCTDFYPIQCDDMENPTAEGCTQVGLIGCDKETNTCPAFFQPNADRHEDQVSGLVVFILAIAILFVCLFGLVTMLQKMLLGTSTRIIHKATNVNGYVAILLGAGVTMVIQSSSITTSALTPLVGVGALRLEQMFPLTLGANIGTTVTAIMSALVTSGTEALQVALAHLFFNLSGTIVWYPIPFMRRIPLGVARKLGKATRMWKGFPVLYIAVCFVLIPLVVLGVASLFTADSKGLAVMGFIIVSILIFGGAYAVYYCHYKGGRENCISCMAKREARNATMESLPEDMESIKAKMKELELLKEQMAALMAHTGMDQENKDVESSGDAESFPV